MIQIPAALIEFDPKGNTIWVHGPQGGTILRIKSWKGFTVDSKCENPCSHSDILVDGPIKICLADDAEGQDE